MKISDAMALLIDYDRLMNSAPEKEAEKTRRYFAAQLQKIFDQHDDMGRGIEAQTSAIISMGSEICSLKETVAACEDALESCRTELCYAILGDGTECSDWVYTFDQKKIDAALELINQKD